MFLPKVFLQSSSRMNRRKEVDRQPRQACFAHHHASKQENPTYIITFQVVGQVCGEGGRKGRAHAGKVLVELLAWKHAGIGQGGSSPPLSPQLFPAFPLSQLVENYERVKA